MFAFEKCGPVNGPDSECADYQYTKVIPIRLVAYAGQAEEVYLDFSIIFEPDCTKDTISFNEGSE